MVGFSEENIHGVGSQGKELSLSSLFSLEQFVSYNKHCGKNRVS